jgi:FKBP-type peptidyl-prolyl cis-trans isomerase 2
MITAQLLGAATLTKAHAASENDLMEHPPPPPSPLQTQQQQQQQQRLAIMRTPSGLKYIDIIIGTGPSPAYGQLVSIQYKGYVKLPANKNDPDPKPVQFDQANAFLLKHGNGRLIPGLDEGIHGMKVGGFRRIIIPPKLGFVDTGLGPIPEYPWDRWKLNSLLDQMVRMTGGTLVYEVQLLSVIDDEADQGYYQDTSLSPEDFETLKNNIQRKAAASRAGNQ